MPYRYGKTKWERSITSSNIAYTWIAQVKDSLPRPIFWLAMSAPAESTYVPLAVAPLPEAYAKNDRAKYDPAKAWWISQQVTTLTKGYYSAMAPKVLETARKGEQRSMELVANASGQSKEEFAQTLRGNAERVLTDWRGLYGKLLAEHDGGKGLEYDKAFQPKADKVLKY